MSRHQDDMSLFGVCFHRMYIVGKYIWGNEARIWLTMGIMGAAMFMLAVVAAVVIGEFFPDYESEEWDALIVTIPAAAVLWYLLYRRTLTSEELDRIEVHGRKPYVVGILLYVALILVPILFLLFFVYVV